MQKELEGASDQAASPRVALDEPLTEEKVFVASQWQLMWWRFRKHKAAVVSTIIILFFYLTAAVCEFFSPLNPLQISERYVLAPPQAIRFMSKQGFRLRPFVYGLKPARHPVTFRLMFEIDESQAYPIYFFEHGQPYRLLGLVPTDVHLFGLRDKEGTIFLLGTDRLGRDMFSRLLYGTRISLSIGLVGIAISFVLGILIGGVSGYYGGLVDVIVQRVIEFIRSIPSIPLWMTLSAALPNDWSQIRIYLGITVILSLISWTGLARVVRGRFLSLREEDFVMAARLAGASELRIIVRHLVPSFLSYIIASLTLTIPGMILSETSLSFLGLGLRPPAISWGVLLQEAQNIRTLAHSPWLLFTGVVIIVVVLCFNFMGDGLRDAADPYSR